MIQQIKGPLPGRFNQEESTELRNQNLVKNIQLGANISSTLGEEDPVAMRSRKATIYNTHAKPHLEFEQKPEHNSFTRK